MLVVTVKSSLPIKSLAGKRNIFVLFMFVIQLILFRLMFHVVCFFELSKIYGWQSESLSLLIRISFCEYLNIFTINVQSST